MDDKAVWDATQFRELLDLFNLKQHVCVPTHKRGHILGASGRKNVEVMEQFISDHKVAYFNLNLQKPLHVRRTVVSCKLMGFDFDGFNEMTGSSGLSDGCVSQSIESLAREYDEVLCKALDRLAPKRTCTIVIRPSAPWNNEEIAIKKRKRQRLNCHTIHYE